MLPMPEMGTPREAQKKLCRQRKFNVIQSMVGENKYHNKLDASANISEVHKDLVPKAAYTRRDINISGISSLELRAPVVRLRVCVGDKRFWVEAAVLDNLKKDMLLGMNYDGYLDLMEDAIRYKRLEEANVHAIMTKSQTETEKDKVENDRVADEWLLQDKLDLEDDFFIKSRAEKPDQTRRQRREEPRAAFNLSLNNTNESPESF